MSELLGELRGIGLTMVSRYPRTSFTDPETKEDHVSQLHLGWTTDQEKANKAREMGAIVTSCKPDEPGFSGWEISVRVIDP